MEGSLLPCNNMESILYYMPSILFVEPNLFWNLIMVIILAMTYYYLYLDTTIISLDFNKNVLVIVT